MTVTIDASGRILLPAEVQDRLGLSPGAELELDVRDAGDGAPTLELRAPAGVGLVERDGLLVHTGRWIGDTDVVRILKRQREERARRHAGLGDEAG